MSVKSKKDINIAIGENIKRERERSGLTQDRFSEMIGIGPKSLSAIERGTVGISISALQRACKVLSISSDALIFGITPENDVQMLTDRLKRLSPAEFQLANTILCTLLEAFSLHNNADAG